MGDVIGSSLLLAKDVNRVLGGLDRTTEAGAVVANLVSDENIVVVVKEVLAGIEGQLLQAEWLLGLLGTLAGSGGGSGASAEVYKEFFDALVVRASDLASVLDSLCSSSMASGPASDVTIKTLVHLYKVLGSIVKVAEAAKTPPPEALVRLVRQVVALSQHAYSLVSYLQTYAVASSANRISKELKLIPSLVYAIEQYEVLVLSLAKASGVNLARNMRRSTVRDFKIKNDVVAVVLESDPAADDGARKKKRKAAAAEASPAPNEENVENGAKRARPLPAQSAT